MAKAASKHAPPIDWRSLKDVHEHVAKVYLSTEHVQRWWPRTTIRRRLYDK
jgi:hypothetical protein